MTTVAFIGLGIMGGPMAANLVKAGFEVVGYNRSPEAVQRLVDAGGRGAKDVAEAVQERRRDRHDGARLAGRRGRDRRRRRDLRERREGRALTST